jgi:nucleoside-triphosphatase THEP1
LKSIFIVSGEKESGKTTFLINILSLLQLNGFLAGGFVALHNIESDCYEIKDVKTNETTPLMQRVASFEERPHHFKFFPKGVEMGNDCMKRLLIHPPDIAMIDEIGGYELRGKLWSSSFTQLVESPIPLIFTVKDRLLDKVVAKWRVEPSHIFSSACFNDTDKAFKLIKRDL